MIEAGVAVAEVAGEDAPAVNADGVQEIVADRGYHSLSGVSLEWCRQIALEVSPEPSAALLFEGVAALEARLVDLAKSPFVHVRR